MLFKGGVTWTSYTSPHALGIVPLKIITDKVLSYSFASTENLLLNFTRPLYKEFVNTAKKFWFFFLRSDTVRLSDSTPETFNE